MKRTNFAQVLLRELGLKIQNETDGDSIAHYNTQLRAIKMAQKDTNVIVVDFKLKKRVN